MENGNQTQEKQLSVKVRVKRSLYSTPLIVPPAVVGIKAIGAPFSSLTVYSHLRNLSVKLQVSSNCSPVWHTGATTEGEISTTPELILACQKYMNIVTIKLIILTFHNICNF